MTTDRTVIQKDTSAEKQDASKGKQETSEQIKTYDEAAVQKIVNDRLAQAGRDAKALEQQKADLKVREEAHNQWLKERDEEEYEKARGNPDAISALQREREAKAKAKELKDERDALERDKVAFQVEKDAIATATKVTQVAALATKYKVDIADLNEFDLPIESIEKLAIKISSIPPAELAKITNTKVEPKKRDSGVTLGSGVNLSGLTPEETLKEIDRMMRENK